MLIDAKSINPQLPRLVRISYVSKRIKKILPNWNTCTVARNITRGWWFPPSVADRLIPRSKCRVTRIELQKLQPYMQFVF